MRNFSAIIPSRYILSVLGSIAMAIIYGLKVNLSVAMVAMVNHTAVALHGGHENHDSSLGNFTDSGREECQGDSKNSSDSGSQVNFLFQFVPYLIAFVNVKNYSVNWQMFDVKASKVCLKNRSGFRDVYSISFARASIWS